MSRILRRRGFTTLHLFLLIAATLFCEATSAQLRLSVSGDTVRGYKALILNGNTPVLDNNGEFSLKLSNTDLSTGAFLSSWTGKIWTGNDSLLVLTRESYIRELDLNLSTKVVYQLIHKNIVKKTISLFQPGMPSVLYSLRERFIPAQKPVNYVSFEHEHFPGGFVHEMFPSVGFVDRQHMLISFLTDPGYKNEYTRITRRRFSGREGGMTGLRKLPDPELMTVASPDEQQAGKNYIQMTFGEMYNLDAGTTKVFNSFRNFKATGLSHIQQINRDIRMEFAPARPGEKGVEILTPFRDQQVYTISFRCKGDVPLALKLFRIKNGRKTVELEEGLKYMDHFKMKSNDWTLFKGSILVPYIEKDSVSLFIGTLSEKKGKLQISDLKIEEHQPSREPYNILPIGESREKTTYMFFEPWKDHKEFMISSQSKLAEGMGFRGTTIEKMLYGNMNALTWITAINDFSPFNVPNMNYSPDMYNRDSFFSTVATYNKELNLGIWEQWSKTQTPKGCIATIITPGMGSTEAKDNEATIEWLIWAMLNKRRFGARLPHEKIKKAADYVLNEFDADRDGKCRSHFPMSQVDIIDYQPKTDRLAVNQGMLAIALRTIKELGFDIEESYIQKTEQEYRNFYDPQRKHLLFDRNYPDIISLTDLEPEFFSLWLFNRPILKDQMVISHLDQFPSLNRNSASPHPEYGTTAPICIRLINKKPGYTYLSATYQPFEAFGAANYADGKNDGFYYNGGSWLRAEYCAYVTGLKHGWKKATALMENRIWAEINLNPEWPFSKEFIPTKWTTTSSWWPSTKGLCWNIFILMANEVAGLRSPDMDPDYQKNKIQ